MTDYIYEIDDVIPTCLDHLIASFSTAQSQGIKLGISQSTRDNLNTAHSLSARSFI